MENFGAEDIVDVNDYEVDLKQGSGDYAKIEVLRLRAWTLSKWEPSDAWLYHGPNGTAKVKGASTLPLEEDALANLGVAPGTELQFLEKGWEQDFCEVCGFALHQTPDVIEGQGYTEGQVWICHDCYRLFIAPEAVFAGKFPVGQVSE